MSREYKKQINNYIDKHPYETGEPHPVEDVFHDLINEMGEDFFSIVIDEIFYDNLNKPSSILTLLMSLSHMNLSIIEPWIYDLLYIALDHYDLEVRSSAVFSLENIGTYNSLEILDNHFEYDPWLSTYIKQVLIDYGYIDN